MLSNRAKSRSQAASLPGARSLMKPVQLKRVLNKTSLQNQRKNATDSSKNILIE